MTKYFTKEQVMNAMEERNLMLDDIWGVEQRLDELPAADVAPVVHAKWEHTHTSESYFNECWRCSACGFDDTEGFVFEFCPHCGARMDGR